MVADGWCVCVRLHCALCMGEFGLRVKGVSAIQGSLMYTS